MDFLEDIDWVAAGLGGGLSLIFIVMIWKVQTWTTFNFATRWGFVLDGRIVLTILLPIVSYFLVRFQLNK